MAITLGSNISALKAQRQLFSTSQQLSTVFERLASGQRINRASDDAAGLAIAESLRADSRVYSQGVRNLNDGLSLLNIADSTVAELSGIVIRIQELAEQAANGSVSNTQRESLDLEAQELAEEFFRVSRESNFNDTRLFDGSIENGVRLQGGYGEDGSIFSSLGGRLGDGTFSEVASVTLGGNVREAEAKDIDGDGNLDLVLTNATNRTVDIAFGAGDGSFGDTEAIAVGLVSNVSASDINNDGVLDLITSSSSSEEVVVALGRGDGTFFENSTIGGIASPDELSVGDLNGDGVQDIVVGGSTGNEVSVLLGNGDGTFQDAQTSYLSGGAVSEFKLADLNGDGISDLAVANYNTASQEVLIGNGDGTFQTGQVVNSGTYSYLMELGDLNGDGVTDLIYDDYQTTSVYFQIGNGDGTFQSQQLLSSFGNGAFDLLSGDANGDGFTDVFVSTDSFVSSVFSGRGDGTFQETATFSLAGNQGNEAIFADLNGDGVLDLARGSGPRARIFLGGTREGINPILEFSLGTQADALQAIAPLDRKLNSLSEQRGIIGAFQSRLQTAVATLSATNENYASAESRIRDADIAFESSQLTRLNILQQAASAVLSQANVQPALALQLLS